MINYFLGSDILPTGVIPITSIITRIRYASSALRNQKHEDIQTQLLHYEQLRDYLAVVKTRMEGLKELQ